MKHFKKFFSYLVALTMVLSLAAFTGVKVHAAEDTNSIVINNARDGHVYEAYQIFSGDYSGGKLTDITKGTGVDVSKLIGVLKGDEKFGKEPANIFHDVTTAEDVAKVLSDRTNFTDNAENVQQFAQDVSKCLTENKASSEAAAGKTATIEKLTTGYYFVKDADSNENVDVYTRFITKVVNGPVNVDLKADVPSVVKKVQDEKDDKDAKADNDGYGDTADHEINESFNFKLTATIPAATDVENYKDAYKLVFHDKMSKGITFEKIGSVQLSNKETEADGTEKLTNTQEVKETAYSKSDITTNEDGTQDWTLTIADLKKEKVADLDFKKDIVVTVIYSAHLNANATVTKASGATDNQNSVSLDYSNNPNATAGGTHNTQGNTVYVFTYGLDNTKVDNADTNDNSNASDSKVFSD